MNDGGARGYLSPNPSPEGRGEKTAASVTPLRLGEGLGERKSIRTTFPYCGVGCGVLATADGKGGLTITGDPDHPANRGRLCSKGMALGETLSLEGRLLCPRIHGQDAG